MKRVFLVLFLTAMALLTGCSKDPEVPENPAEPEQPAEKIPEIRLKTIQTEVTTIRFEAKLKDVEKAAYVVLEEEAGIPDIHGIMQNGTAIPAADRKTEITVENLKAETTYRIVAAAINGTKEAISNVLNIETYAYPEVSLKAEVVSTTFESVEFKVTHENATRICYRILASDEQVPQAEEVLKQGTQIDLASAASVVAGELKDRTTYKLAVAAQGQGEDQTILANPVLFTTKEDESKIIHKDYTHAKALVSKNNYYVQFYFEGNEDEILSLDFYARGGDYLPAGTYDVMDIDSPTGIGMQFSKYGTTSIGTKVSGGTTEVNMDKTAGIYFIHADVYLEDGQHIIADFEGEVENMPIREKIEFDAVQASAVRSGNGWNIEFGNGTPNEKMHFSIVSGSEEFLEESRYELSGQNSGSYCNESDERFAFQTGELNVIIDWEKMTYDITFSGTLADRTLCTFKYNGEIEGMTIKKPVTVNELVFTSASAIDFGGGNFFVKLTNTDDSYNSITIDFYCDPSSGTLAEGTYTYGQSDPGYFSTSSKLVGTDRDFLYFDEGTATVSYSGENFVIDLTVTVTDGRVFHSRYEGPVSGISIP